MFAVIKTGGKQYRVSPDDTIQIERIEGDEGSRVTFGHVMMTGAGADVSIGTPAVDGASVTAEVVEHHRSKKTISFKKRRRQNSRRKKGHRQLLTTVSILEILTGGAKPSRDASGKSAQQRHEEREADYLTQLGAAGASAKDETKGGKKGKRVSEDGDADGATGSAAAMTASGNVGDADPAATGTDASGIEAQEATAAALAEDEASKSSAKADGASAKGASVASEDDEADDREAEMAAEHAQSEVDVETAKAGSAATKELPDEPLFTAPEGEPDKLTKIKGIGPVAERQLNEQGITTFAQIASLSDEDIVRIDEYMPFSDAQIRTWREQAEALK